MAKGKLRRFRAGNIAQEKARVGRLRVVDEEWLAAIRPAYVWIDDPDQPSYRPIASYVIDPRGAIRGSAFHEGTPTTEEALSALLASMYAPPLLSGGGRRPARVAMDSPEWVAELGPALAELGIECRLRERMPEIDRVQAWMCKQMTGRAPVPGLLSIEGVTLPLVKRLYEQAARLYRHEPWNHLNDWHPMAISTPPEANPRYVIVMGSSGQVYGLSIHDTLDDLHAMFASHSHQQVVRSRTWSVLFYEEARAVSFADLDAIARYDLEVVGHVAYPVFGRSTRNAELIEPRPDDVHFVDAAMAALNQHLDDFERGDVSDLWPVDRVLDLQGLSGPLRVRLHGDDMSSLG